MENKIVLQKNAEKSGKIRLPKFVIETFGKSYFMEIHKEKIVLIPVKNDGIRKI